MYRNHCNDPFSITEFYGTSSSDFGTAKLCDNNLQTYFLGNGSTLVPNILFNFGTQVYVDSIIIVHDLNSVGTLYVKAGDSNPPVTATYGLPIQGSTGTSVNFFSPEVSYIYWQLFADGTNMGTPIRINEVFIGKRDTFSVNPSYPFKKEIEASTIVTESEKGQRKVYHKYTKQRWGFDYSSISDSLNGTFNKIKGHCSGSYRPFYFCEDIDDNKFDTHFVRFVKNSYKHINTMVDCHDVSFSLEEEL